MPTGASIAINELERLTCMAIGGNPPAILKWYKSERHIFHLGVVVDVTVVSRFAGSP